ncbi:MAG: hypothetical protein HFE75_16735 [Firmicutes bacterium]|nr:hypothetical protein [Bacillota bacterium]
MKISINKEYFEQIPQFTSNSVNAGGYDDYSNYSDYHDCVYSQDAVTYDDIDPNEL